MITQLGSLNTAALQVADVYIQIVPPQFLINGVPSNVLGLVGSAAWGPVNNPQIIGSLAQYQQIFGSYQNRNFDMGTHAAIAFQQGASAIAGVRVTDGTDVAATIVASVGVQATGTITFTGQPTAAQVIVLNGTSISFVASGATGNQVNIAGTIAATLAALMVFLQGSLDVQLVKFTYSLTGLVLTLTAVTPGVGGNSLTTTTTVTGATASGATLAGGVAAATMITFTSKYTGSAGNGIVVSVGPGSAANSTLVKVAMPGVNPEIFDNIIGAGNARWLAMAAAINNGQSGARGPSQIISALAAAGTVAPLLASYSLAGGTDGATTITGTIMLGVDTNPRTGMYALRGQNVSVAVLCDLTDTTTWATQNAFGLAEGVYMLTATAAGDTPSVCAATKATAGIDSYAMKIMLGDWVYWNDTQNNAPNRLVSPCAFAAGLLANLSPQNSTLNKALLGIVATQKSITGLPYTTADLQVLALAGIDVICNPVPGGRYFGCRNGRNASSNPAVHGDNYTRMTNFIAATLNAAMGIFVGKLQSATVRRQAKTAIDTFFANLQQQGMIGVADGSSDAWVCVLDNSNNPFSRVALGYMQADVQVTYLSIIEFFIVNLEAGQTVQITRKAVNFAI